MNITKWAHGVLTGRVAHWNDINNQLIADIWPAIEMIKPPHHERWKNAVLSALGMMERMMGPDRGLKGIVGIDLKKVTREQTGALYAELITAFVSESMRLTPSLASTLTAEYIQIAERMGVKRVSFSPPTSDIEKVVDSLWLRVADIIASPRKSDLRAIFEFKSMFIAHATQNMSS